MSVSTKRSTVTIAGRIVWYRFALNAQLVCTNNCIVVLSNPTDRNWTTPTPASPQNRSTNGIFLPYGI